MILELSFCLLILVVRSIPHKCNFDIRIKQALLNNGFHRNLTYDIELSGREDAAESATRWPRDCRVGLEQALPAGVYADPDQLNNLRRVGKVNAAVSGKVNIELSAEEASSNHIYVIENILELQVLAWVPLHARYQDAQRGFPGKAVNIITRPKLYMQCPDSRLDSCGLPTPERIPVLCSTKNKCKWKHVPFQLMSEPVEWDVPIGDLTHTAVVTMGTFIIVLLGSLHLLKAMHKFNCSINSKITSQTGLQ